MSAPRTILITGSAKRLGASLARALAKDGHRIAIHYRTSRAEAEETQATIRKAGGTAEIFGSPMSTLTEAGQLAAEIISRLGPIDTLINNAGVFDRKHFDEMTQEDWEIGISSTVTAAFVATRAALPHLRTSGRGRIVNIGDSMADRFGVAERAMSYYVGKHGIWLMTRTLAATEAQYKVTVNMVSPGVLEDTVCSTPIEDMPLGRYGTHDEIARAIRFLLEDGNEALTGSNLNLGGGWNLGG